MFLLLMDHGVTFFTACPSFLTNLPGAGRGVVGFIQTNNTNFSVAKETFYIQRTDIKMNDSSFQLWRISHHRFAQQTSLSALDIVTLDLFQLL